MTVIVKKKACDCAPEEWTCERVRYYDDRINIYEHADTTDENSIAFYYDDGEIYVDGRLLNAH